MPRERHGSKAQRGDRKQEDSVPGLACGVFPGVMTKYQPQFPTLILNAAGCLWMARCLQAQPLPGDLCHYKDVLLQLHDEIKPTSFSFAFLHHVGAPAQSLLLVETEA